MKKNRFTDCPVCGASDSMHLKTDFSQKVHVTGYKPFTIHGLEGLQCTRCRETILTATANKHFDSSMAEEMARQDSHRTAAFFRSVAIGQEEDQIILSATHPSTYTVQRG